MIYLSDSFSLKMVDYSVKCEIVPEELVATMLTDGNFTTNIYLENVRDDVEKALKIKIPNSLNLFNLKKGDLLFCFKYASKFDYDPKDKTFVWWRIY